MNFQLASLAVAAALAQGLPVARPHRLRALLRRKARSIWAPLSATAGRRRGG
jgi:hypothetical protein